MVTAARAPAFVGRTSEREVLDRLLANVGGGQSAVLVIRGEAGIGKTALLRYAARRTSGFRVAQVTGAEAEMERPFAGFHQLCAPMLSQLDALPQPQQDALRVALGLASGQVPDRFLVGLAVLGLLSAVAEERPLLCLVDDAQWLDAASGLILGFVMRRLLAESVAVVVAVREPSARHDFDGLPQLMLRGLGEQDARTLLRRAVPGRLDDRVGDRIVAETRGNPLALLDLPRSRSAAELAGGFEVLSTSDLPRQLEDHYLQRAGELPEATQRLLLLAAAEPTGDATLVWRAADRRGIDRSALAPADDAQLVEIGARVRFRHPLVRSAAYRAAAPPERRAAHRALAEATDPDTDPDRRAWHRAHAAVGLDEDVAGELERSADRAQARGGTAAAAAFLTRATELTPAPGKRGARALAAARAQFEAGAPDTAHELLATAEIGPLDQLQRAQAERLRAEIAFARRRGSDAPPLLLKAARRLEPLDAELARDTYLDALSAALYVGRRAGPAGVVEVAEAARAALAARHLSGRAPDLLLDGLAVLVTDGYPAGAPVLRHALRAFSEEEDSGEDALRWLWLASRTAGYVWDDAGWDLLTARHLQQARDAGALTELPVALAYRAAVHVHAGELDVASALIEEASALAPGSAPVMYVSLMLAAWQGREERVSELMGAAAAERASQDDGRPLAAAEWMRAVLCNGLGRYDDAFTAGERAARLAHELGPSLWALPELIEAAARTDIERAGDALERLTETTRASGGDWALGIEARSRALVSDGELADSLYREAIERLARTRVVVHLARAQLVYGEWLRREHRRVAARDQLRAAHETFSRIGAQAFAERARRELLATGETVRKRRADTRDELTPQERQIARLARDGLSNPEIGARIFLSPRTVEWHLHKVFTKLEIRSRHELSGALPSSESELAPA